MNLVLFHKYVLTTALTKLPNANTLGITNETEDGFLPFIDYDDILYSKVIEDIRRVQKVFYLDTAVVLSTEEKKVNDELTGNYLVVFLDIVNHGTCRDILEWVRCDRKYRSYWRLLYQKNWVVRIAEKIYNDSHEELKIAPSFKEIIYPKHRSTVYKKSKAYYLFFRKHFNMPRLHTNFVNDKTVTLIPYLTSK